MIAAIEPKTHLVEVGRQMFRADLMPCPHESAP